MHPLALFLTMNRIVLQLLNDYVKEDPEMPLAMAAYRALNEVVRRSHGTLFD